MNSSLSNEEKKQLSYQRQNAVRTAWKQEKDRVSEGIGTRKWSDNEQKELLERGRVSGYEGHHMKSVSLYPEYAGDPHNIQFLSESEHLYGAHGGDYHTLTNGYYDPETRIMHDFGEELKPLPLYSLNNKESSNMEIKNLREELIKEQTEAGKEHNSHIKSKAIVINEVDDKSEYVIGDSLRRANGISRR